MGRVLKSWPSSSYGCMRLPELGVQGRVGAGVGGPWRAFWCTRFFGARGLRSNLAARFGEFPGPSQRVNWGSGAAHPRVQSAKSTADKEGRESETRRRVRIQASRSVRSTQHAARSTQHAARRRRGGRARRCPAPSTAAKKLITVMDEAAFSVHQSLPRPPRAYPHHA